MGHVFQRAALVAQSSSGLTVERAAHVEMQRLPKVTDQTANATSPSRPARRPTKSFTTLTPPIDGRSSSAASTSAADASK